MQCMKHAEKKRVFVLCIALAAVLTLLLYMGLFATRCASEPVTLKLALYEVIPDSGSFEDMVRECWKEIHPEVELSFVDWNCYGSEVPEDLDVFVFDTTNLDVFSEKGYLLPLSEKDIRDYDDLIPSFMEGCRVDGTICAVPQILCTDLLYTRKSDPEAKSIQSIDGLYSALGGSGLLTDKKSDSIKICMYLQAMVDEAQRYMDYYPPVAEGQLSQRAVKSLTEMKNMRQTDPGGTPENSGRFYYAQNFAQGMGRAYIGYSEAMYAMGEKASEMDFRLFSMTDGHDIPVFYVDAAAVNAKISDQKKPLAMDLLNMITGKDMLVKAFVCAGEPQYLLAARTSVFDELMSEYPIYAKLKEIVLVPDAYVFRIRPDGVAYMEQAEKNADLLPALFR